MGFGYICLLMYAYMRLVRISTNKHIQPIVQACRGTDLTSSVACFKHYFFCSIVHVFVSHPVQSPDLRVKPKPESVGTNTIFRLRKQASQNLTHVLEKYNLFFTLRPIYYLSYPIYGSFPFWVGKEGEDVSNRLHSLDACAMSKWDYYYADSKLGSHTHFAHTNTHVAYSKYNKTLVENASNTHLAQQSSHTARRLQRKN